MDIGALREEITAIDKALLTLLEKRLEIVGLIAYYKKEQGLPILDAKRETELLSYLAACGKKSTAEDMKGVFASILQMSKHLQLRILFPYPLFFIGYMGAGKSTLAKELALCLRCEYQDLDLELEKEEGVAIATLLKTKGMDYFREREKDRLGKTRSGFHLVATGGGVIEKEENRLYLRQRGFVVYLRATPATLFSRLSSCTKRPLKPQTEKELELHLGYRAPLYEETAHYILDTEGKTLNETIAALEGVLYKRLPTARA